MTPTKPIKRISHSHYKKDGTPKYGFESMEKAQQAARNIERKQHEPMSVYDCAECHRWHVGHDDSAAVPKPIERPIEKPIPVSRAGQVASKLQAISQTNEIMRATITHKSEESKRLYTLAHSLFEQSVAAEERSKQLRQEVQTLGGDLAVSTSQEQTLLNELNQIYGRMGAAQ